MHLPSFSVYKTVLYWQEGLEERITTNLLHRLQAQTLPDATPPIGKIHPFSKMAITFEPLMHF